ncbi:putative aspartyl protease [Rheinheimera pacifica]|uniref:retropepsin-like aspartic protease n=1 Tax=Rheinheimera pacifica TaxID=173990 RepID=UPI00216A5461|nr:retropepsin-like aspartic protease [Rheinheimera pacifica]MCS4305761.1 putative aspartyl protease [Rheinheimera pacifica]
MLKYTLMLCLLFAVKTGAAVTEWIDFKMENGAILFPIKINGQNTHAVLDTKAKVNFIAESFIDQHRDNLRRTGVILFKDNDGERNAEVYQDIKVNIFDVELTFSDLIAVQNVAGELVLGIPFLRQHIIQLDFPNKRMRLIGHNQLDMTKLANVLMQPQVDLAVASTPGSQSIKKNDQSARALRVSVHGKDMWLTFDTAIAEGVALNRDAAQKEGLLTRAFAADAAELNLATSVNREVFILNSVKIGPYELENVSLGVEVEGGKRLIPFVPRKVRTGTNISRDVQATGSLGLDAMQHFVVTFDYLNSLVRFDVQ